jgi:BirA family transcriptional regulator, biotin operon repressor / biotin---[acetyl-CoA-carboxylase] ligase
VVAENTTLRGDALSSAAMSIDPRNLLAALNCDEPVSGTALAARLGVTRAAVWKQIEVLRTLGAPIEASAGSGYQLEHALELLDADRVRTELDATARARIDALDVHWQIDSTNSELLRRPLGRTRQVQICLAETQSAGRGRRGRIWQSPLGGNLYFSLSARFEQGMGTLAGLSLAVGVATVQALTDCGACGVGLKWPNDVLADGRKLAGILVELGGEFLGPCQAVIGIGINLRLTPALLARIDQPAIDLASLLDGAPPPRNRLAACLIARLIAALDRFVADGFAAFQSDYAHYDLLRDRDIRVLSAGNELDGVGAGVDQRGALVLRRGAALENYDSAEVSVRTR